MDQAGFATAHLVGNSLGGYVALQLAARGRARTVVAFSPACDGLLDLVGYANREGWKLDPEKLDGIGHCPSSTSPPRPPS